MYIWDHNGWLGCIYSVDSGKIAAKDVSFARLAAANLHYSGAFAKLLKPPPSPALWQKPVVMARPFELIMDDTSGQLVKGPSSFFFSFSGLQRLLRSLVLMM